MLVWCQANSKHNRTLFILKSKSFLQINKKKIPFMQDWKVHEPTTEKKIQMFNKHADFSLTLKTENYKWIQSEIIYSSSQIGRHRECSFRWWQQKDWVLLFIAVAGLQVTVMLNENQSNLTFIKAKK